VAKLDVVKAIAASGFTIYDSLDTRPDLFVDIAMLEALLNGVLIGLDLNYPLRTRSKVLKTGVCAALGYPVPPVLSKDRTALSRPELRHARPEGKQSSNLEPASSAIAAVRANSGQRRPAGHARQGGYRRDDRQAG
jgi:hypothetical protein